jgi:hypothetical protein
MHGLRGCKAEGLAMNVELARCAVACLILALLLAGCRNRGDAMYIGCQNVCDKSPNSGRYHLDAKCFKECLDLAVTVTKDK